MSHISSNENIQSSSIPAVSHIPNVSRIPVIRQVTTDLPMSHASEVALLRSLKSSAWSALSSAMRSSIISMVTTDLTLTRKEKYGLEPYTENEIRDFILKNEQHIVHSIKAMINHSSYEFCRVDGDFFSDEQMLDPDNIRDFLDMDVEYMKYSSVAVSSLIKSSIVNQITTDLTITRKEKYGFEPYTDDEIREFIIENETRIVDCVEDIIETHNGFRPDDSYISSPDNIRDFLYFHIIYRDMEDFDDEDFDEW